MLQYFLREYDVVSKFAVHPHTKKPISRELHAAMIQESTRFWAIDAEHTLFLAALDQHYHSADFMASPDLQRGLQRISEDYLSTLPDNVPRYRTFRHLTSYASSYYSYPWCQAMAGFIWSECFQSRPLDRHTGERYREHILAPGSSGNEWRRIEHMIGFKPSVQDLAEGLSRP
ncbi:hypothetical protein PTSG_04569 [Salpingoeca rosetta]|uniref:Peptidase M3A/M3B catalytic domain-containing protein n=1 Tax=Salpingoeca rosetta (strain ATCC 50818 / BSB-021) TaxID=946362 RepID=F2U7T5_SALR5|nr:uncharacterized protein PTSG_04569 [Salpingoeca rosetta]EGD72840.1 hypothetical protein PTSG_04569 [Salpingoeca rosetta]|eukprot:XP_004994663.1 hypothetical protein PTSG_04569 [Salpingoeca rosetta]